MPCSEGRPVSGTPSGRATDSKPPHKHDAYTLTYNAFYAAGENAEEHTAQCRLLRDVLGNPFRLVRGDPTWLTSTVLQLASGIYEECAFDRLPILADALMDAGCDNPDILAHCRSDGPHVRGCWVVDLLLGKA